MTLAARLAALEQRRPPTPKPPTPLTDAQRRKLENKLILDYCTLGRDGFITKFGAVVGIGTETAERTADDIEALAAWAQARLEGR